MEEFFPQGAQASSADKGNAWRQALWPMLAMTVFYLAQTGSDFPLAEIIHHQVGSNYDAVPQLFQIRSLVNLASLLPVAVLISLLPRSHWWMTLGMALSGLATALWLAPSPLGMRAAMALDGLGSNMVWLGFWSWLLRHLRHARFPMVWMMAGVTLVLSTTWASLMGFTLIDKLTSTTLKLGLGLVGTALAIMASLVHLARQPQSPSRQAPPPSSPTGLLPWLSFSGSILMMSGANLFTNSLWNRAGLVWFSLFPDSILQESLAYIAFNHLPMILVATLFMLALRWLKLEYSPAFLVSIGLLATASLVYLAVTSLTTYPTEMEKAFIIASFVLMNLGYAPTQALPYHTALAFSGSRWQITFLALCFAPSQMLMHLLSGNHMKWHFSLVACFLIACGSALLAWSLVARQRQARATREDNSPVEQPGPMP